MLAMMLAAGALYAGSIQTDSVYSAGPSNWTATVVLKTPPCGTPEAKREKGGACTAWVVRRDPIQPPDEWPPYELPSRNLLEPKPTPSPWVSTCCGVIVPSAGAVPMEGR